MKYIIKAQYLQDIAIGGYGPWFRDNVGREFVDWHYNWMTQTFFFKREEDKVKFILRYV